MFNNTRVQDLSQDLSQDQKTLYETYIRANTTNNCDPLNLAGMNNEILQRIYTEQLELIYHNACVCEEAWNNFYTTTNDLWDNYAEGCMMRVSYMKLRMDDLKDTQIIELCSKFLFNELAIIARKLRVITEQMQTWHIMGYAYSVIKPWSECVFQLPENVLDHPTEQFHGNLGDDFLDYYVALYDEHSECLSEIYVEWYNRIVRGSYYNQDHIFTHEDCLSEADTTLNDSDHLEDLLEEEEDSSENDDGDDANMLNQAFYEEEDGHIWVIG